MSASNINLLLNIWAATLTLHNNDPPFHNHTDLYNIIDSTPIGDVPWESFIVKYDGDIPNSERSPWMDEEFEVWFCNPRELIHNMLTNPDFDSELMFTCQEYIYNMHSTSQFMCGDCI